MSARLSCGAFPDTGAQFVCQPSRTPGVSGDGDHNRGCGRDRRSFSPVDFSKVR